MKTLMDALFFIIGFGAILFLAYVTTKYLAGKSATALKGRYIHILETVSLGLDKKIHLVKVNDEYILIASSGKSIEFLTKVDLQEVEREAESQKAVSGFDFKALFEKYVKSLKSKSQDRVFAGNAIEKNGAVKEEDSFRNNLDKLRSINRRVRNERGEDGDDKLNET